MSIRRALIGGVSILLLVAIGIVVTIGANRIRQSVIREALSRVDHDLSVLSAMYERELRFQTERLRLVGDELRDDCYSESDRRALLAARDRLGLAVLNCVDPASGSFEVSPGGSMPAPDPVVRRALAGEPAWGTLLLDPDQLRREGGAALARSQVVAAPSGDPLGGTSSALFRWHAAPLLDAEGRVRRVIYGGSPINHDREWIDEFVETLFGTERFGDKPVGTVTFFLGDTRVATNVVSADGKRAVGTRVSDEVRERVLIGGQRWSDRAWVVDTWYISGYMPLQDPDGLTIGMLYVGLLEAPYDVLRSRLILQLAAPALLILAGGLLVAGLVVRRITRPLAAIEESATRIESGRWDSPVPTQLSYSEINRLESALHRMQAAIARRDRDLREANARLTRTNADLARVNANYMQTLGFVTHELKAPLANVQSLTELLVDGYAGQLPDAARETLTRIRRNCEDLQDMVKNYLDLSRAERDELQPELREIDLIGEVVAPVLDQAGGVFPAHEMTLEVDTPRSVPVTGDPELLRIALTNYLNNAAKYGRAGGRARLSIEARDEAIAIAVWNEGIGFRAEERGELFRKFSRLKNRGTKMRKGSGLGLYLTDRIVALHGGSTRAESEPGEWARFSFELPATPGAPTECG